MKQSVNERVKLLRTSLRLTQVEFAQELNVSASTIAKIETGEKPSIAVLDAIINKYSVPDDWIINGKGEMTFTKPTQPKNDPWKEEAYQTLKDHNSKR